MEVAEESLNEVNDDEKLLKRVTKHKFTNMALKLTLSRHREVSWLAKTEKGIQTGQVQSNVKVTQCFLRFYWHSSSSILVTKSNGQ